jgi:ABC-type phosphate transport system ATPase subunit
MKSTQRITPDRRLEMTSELTGHVAERGRRELAERESEGLRVQLLWDPIADAVTVAVEDLRAGDRFHLAVARERALDAFYHPFAYAA